MQASVPIPRGNYKHQGDWITSICTATDHIVTASRDKTLCVWDVKDTEQEGYLRPRSLLTGHNHIVQDMVLSSDGQYALSASWDKTLRLWDINRKKSIAQFTGHTHDVLSVSISKGNRQIISAGRDKTIKLWNIHGDCKHTTAELPEWITCAKFGMTDDSSPIVSGGYDRMVRVWDRATFSQTYALAGHTGYISTIAISPDSTLVASGGFDHMVNLWDIPAGKYLYSLNAGAVVNNIIFSPNRFWIAVATDESLKIFCLNKKACITDLKLQPVDLETASSSSSSATAEAEETKKPPKIPKCLTAAFSVDGMNLFAGYSDNYIRCWNIPVSTSTSSN